MEVIDRELAPLSKDVRSDRRVYVKIRREDVRKMAQFMYKLFEPLRGRLSTVSAVDCRSHFEVLYHFTLSQLGLVLTFRCEVPRHEPVVDSISDIIYGASFIEREIHDLFGIVFRGHPNLERLILPDDWPEGVYPLRRYG
ncbi:MAG: NADH-quinone oxidoreductase subunit C [Candidatus Verstraetearchaeota archaeon]|nr:NADH-quinone oxidoreductase subunit C [Candidatus Verstraetearchaeota archaeon]